MGLLDLGKDLFDIATAPVKVVTTVVEAAVKPIADGARAVVEEAEDLLDRDE